MKNIHDIISLQILKYLKINRNKLYNQSNIDKEFYDHFFQENHSYEQNFDIRFILRREQILKCINEIKTEKKEKLKIADIGCGVCDILNRVDSNNLLIGLDYSKNSISLSKKFAISNINLVQGDAVRLPFEKGIFDIIICYEVLEHIKHDDDVITELNKRLKPNGILILSVPNGHYFKEYFELMGHYRHYSRKFLEEKLNNHGIRVPKSLNMYPRFNFIYYYIFFFLNMFNLVYGSITKDTKNIYQRKIPASSVYVYNSILLRIFKKLCRLDMSFNEKDVLKSTFCIVEKVRR